MEQDMRKSIRKTDQLQSFNVWLLSALPIGRFCKELETGLALDSCRNERLLYEFRGCAEKQQQPRTAVSRQIFSLDAGSPMEAHIVGYVVDSLSLETVGGNSHCVPSHSELPSVHGSWGHSFHG